MIQTCRTVFAAATVALGLAQGAAADVIIDWNEKAVANVLARNLGPPPAERVIAMVHLAMFDAINSIDPRYRPYAAQLPAAAGTSKEASAASAAAAVLAALDPPRQAEIRTALATYLAGLPDGDAKARGIALGEAIAPKVIEARLNDGASAPDAYRPATRSGIYVPTPGDVRPAMAGRAALRDDEWCAVPAAAAGAARRSAMGRRLQRDQGAGTVSTARRAPRGRPGTRASGSRPAATSITRSCAPSRRRRASACTKARGCSRSLRRRGSMPRSPSSTPSITTASGGRSPRSATATWTRTPRRSAMPPGSRSPTRRCIRSTRARTAFSPPRWRACWRRCSAAPTCRSSRRPARRCRA